MRISSYWPAKILVNNPPQPSAPSSPSSGKPLPGRPNRRPRLLTHALLFLIKGYQLLLSGLFAPSCRFYPSCSAYAEEAVRKHGAFVGLRLALFRLLRCHPWHPGGIDPVPDGTGDSAPRTQDK